MQPVCKFDIELIKRKAAAMARAETRRKNRILSGDIFTTSTDY
jgi:hypothetical protein